MDDLAVPQHHRSGAHRARRHPLLTVLASLAAVAVFSGVLLWALLTFDVLGAGERLADGSPAGSASASPAASAPAGEPTGATGPTAGASGTPADEPTAEPTGEQGPEGTEDAGEATDGATDASTGAAEVDRTVGVDVLNSTQTTGLAAGAAGDLETVGWTIGEVGNYPDGEVPTTVLYPTSDLAATAEALADDLGVGVVEQSSDVDVVTVVLGADFVDLAG